MVEFIFHLVLGECKIRGEYTLRTEYANKFIEIKVGERKLKIERERKTEREREGAESRQSRRVNET